MIKFRSKIFTIPEGHYTGPKDMDKLPGVIEMVSKSALGGAGVGAVVGAIIKDSSVLEGAVQGAKYGSLTGLILKFFLNYLHNPMSKIKFQDVDKNIRREFGIYRMQGITVGDSVSKRAKVEEKFSTNDRNVTDYKINFAIQDNQVTMYTFGMTDKELEKTSSILDYYCKKYFGMEYTSVLINKKVNAYSVTIVFTNHQVISNFMMELSNELGYKINLLDNKTLVDKRISEVSNAGIEEERDFSVKLMNKYDIMKLLGTSGALSLSELVTGGLKSVKSRVVMELINNSLNKLSADLNTISNLEANGRIPKLTRRGDYTNIYLEKALKNLHYLEGHHYTVDVDNSDLNMSLIQGLFVLTASKVHNNIETIDKAVYNKNKSGINRVDTGKVVVYTYPIKSRNEFDYTLKRLISTGLVPNIFEG